jgi:hypothetical protein
MSITDPNFNYTSSLKTDVLSTWKRFGFRPTSEAERIARQKKHGLYEPREPLRYVRARQRDTRLFSPPFRTRARRLTRLGRVNGERGDAAVAQRPLMPQFAARSRVSSA